MPDGAGSALLLAASTGTAVTIPAVAAVAVLATLVATVFVAILIADLATVLVVICATIPVPVLATGTAIRAAARGATSIARFIRATRLVGH